MNDWWQPTERSYGLTAQGLNTMLRIEDREQGTLRCNGRTDKLCVGIYTVGDKIGPVTLVQNQTLYTLALILRLIRLLLAQFRLVRRDRTIRGTRCSRVLSCL